MHPVLVWKKWARRVRDETHALFIAYRDPQTPWYARLVAAMVIAYALSPIDLIPDFIPVLGYLDDLLLLPLGVALAVRLIPRSVMERARESAAARSDQKLPIRKSAAIAIVAVWMALAIAVGLFVWKHVK